ncbi:MAG: FAD-binding oxidoreductase [Spirochaetes bacterium]|jgi:alkyldihydroxyacetonephosphate synthase|nr:FAD-binding oxidoreductase [Spirochaetota bacterium]
MKSEFFPDWTEQPPGEKSYRSIFKWGAMDSFKHPNVRLFKMMKEKFRLTDSDFLKKRMEGNETVLCRKKSRIPRRHIDRICSIVGRENTAVDDYSRVRYSYGKTIEEAMELRKGVPGNVADLVVHPRNKDDIKKLVKYCGENRIPVCVYGGGSSVTLGLSPSKGGIMLVMGTHMNKIISLNERNQTVTVQPGMMGPGFEDALNNAPERLGANRRYTCGHFPQSFEYSSVGGWVVTLGSGQTSSYYGDAYDLVVSQEYVTPAATFKTLEYPATATGPKLNDIMKGSEGSFGVLVEVTMKIFRHMPENRRSFAFVFPSWEATVDAAREISQGEFGSPSVFRMSDPEETDIALKLYGIEGTIIDSLISLKGYKPMERCLFLGQSEGEKNFTANVKKQVKKICKKHGAMYITGLPVKNWEHGRFTDPYMREDLQDFGIVIDTLESGVTWDGLMKLHEGVRKYIKSRPDIVCMTHGSHFYPQGTNLYFIFIFKTDSIKEYRKFQRGVIAAISKNGGSLSHHHGVGKMIAPFLEDHIGSAQMDVLRALKRHFDPKNIMNPGGQLGLDLPRKRKK